MIRPAQLAGHRQLAEDVANRPEMLCGKDFRGRQQRTLIARVDHLQHRQHRDDRLAGADLALQQAVHRAVRRQPVGQHVEHLALPRRQLEGQPPQQLRRQAVVSTRCRGSGLRKLAAPTGDQRPLQSDGLVEGQSLTRPLAFALVFREVDRAQCLVLGDQAELSAQVFRQRVGHRVEDVEHLADGREDVPALQLRAGGIDRKEATFVCIHDLFGGGGS